MIKTDLIIIGCGPGGYRAAEHAAKNGLQVVVFEGAQVGGTCLNCGCIPTKTMLHEARMAALRMDNRAVAYQHALNRRQEIVEQLRKGVEQLMSMPGITLVRGWASLKDTHTVECNGEEYEASHIIIATGSMAKLPSIDGIDSQNPLVVTSTELLDLDHIPQQLAIIGAGVIGMEFATIFNYFGSKVSVIEFQKECLPMMDSEIAKRLRKIMEKRGVNFYMQAEVKRICDGGITFKRKEQEITIPAEVVLIATGRAPRLPVDAEKMGTILIGDATGGVQLAHAASMEGIHQVNRILGKEDNIRLDIMPAAVFTTPEVAGVGMTEDQCKSAGVEYTCRKSLYRANGKALAINESEGLLKLLADKTGHIIGCHAFGAHAADLIQEVAVLMNFNATVSQLHDIVHIHPTISEILQG